MQSLEVCFVYNVMLKLDIRHLFLDNVCYFPFDALRVELSVNRDHRLESEEEKVP